jgi:AraC-like DNA-binding protein
MMDIQAERRASFDQRFGEGAADKLAQAPYEGKRLHEVALEFKVSRQYISLYFERLTGRTWSEVLREKGINSKGPRRVPK